MLKHIWSLLCRRSTIDEETKNLSINEVLEQLTVDLRLTEREAGDFTHFQVPIEFEVINMWARDITEKKLHANLDIEVINPDGKTIKHFSHTFEVSPGVRRMRSRTRIHGFVIEKTGDYTFKVNIKENDQKTFKTVAELPLEVRLNKEVMKD